MAGVLVRSGVLIAAAAMAFSAHAGPIAVFGDANGSNAVAAFLVNHNLDAKIVQTGGPGSLDGFDVAIALRGTGAPVVKEFVLGGGLLITEFTAAEWALNALQLLNAGAGGNQFLGKGTEVSFTEAGLKLGLGDDLGKQYSDGDRTNAHVTLRNIGAGVDILATAPEPPPFLKVSASLALLDSLADDLPVMIGGDSGKGYVLINSFAWSEELPTGDSPTGQWLLNAVNVNQTQPVPEPGTLALAGLALACLTLARRRRSA